VTAAIGTPLAYTASEARAVPYGFGKGPGYCSQYGNRNSTYSFDGVYACVSTDSTGNTPFDADGDESFQCVELSARFLWAVYGLWAGPGTGVQDGADLVSVVHRRYPRVRVGFPAPGSVPVAGDVVSLGPGGAVDRRFGHTAIVVSDDQGHGHFRMIGQNFPPGEAGTQIAYIDFRGHHNGRALIDGVWTPASWLELRHRPKPRPGRHHRR
jgi:CHAP domain